MQDEIQVRLNRADGLPLFGSDASTAVLKIASLSFIHEYAVVGDLAGVFSPDQNAAVEAKCAAFGNIRAAA